MSDEFYHKIVLGQVWSKPALGSDDNTTIIWNATNGESETSPQSPKKRAAWRSRSHLSGINESDKDCRYSSC